MDESVILSSDGKHSFNLHLTLLICHTNNHMISNKRTSLEEAKSYWILIKYWLQRTTDFYSGLELN